MDEAPRTGTEIHVRAMRTPERHGLAAVAAGLSPIWLTGLLMVAAPHFLAPLGDTSIAIAGVPAGLFLLGVGLLLTVSGALVIWRARSTAIIVAALLLLTFPALVIVIGGPAAIFIALDLGTT